MDTFILIGIMLFGIVVYTISVIGGGRNHTIKWPLLIVGSMVMAIPFILNPNLLEDMIILNVTDPEPVEIPILPEDNGTKTTTVIYQPEETKPNTFGTELLDTGRLLE